MDLAPLLPGVESPAQAGDSLARYRRDRDLSEPGRMPRPLQNRVLPSGEIVALDVRGTMTGNRGVLHDDSRRIVRRWTKRFSSAWLKWSASRRRRRSTARRF